VKVVALQPCSLAGSWWGIGQRGLQTWSDRRASAQGGLSSRAQGKTDEGSEKGGGEFDIRKALQKTHTLCMRCRDGHCVGVRVSLKLHDDSFHRPLPYAEPSRLGSNGCTSTSGDAAVSCDPKADLADPLATMHARSSSSSQAPGRRLAVRMRSFTGRSTKLHESMLSVDGASGGALGAERERTGGPMGRKLLGQADVRHQRQQ
jgi:hypothetical protein